MAFKESYQTPTTEVIKAMEAFSILNDSNVDSSLEDPFTDGTWTL